MKEKDRGLISTTSGLLADIYHNERMLFDAVSEISKALVIEPDCSLIQKKAEEIFDDLNNFYAGMILILINAILINISKIIGRLYAK